MPRRSINQRIEDARVFIENVLDLPDVQSRFAQAGRDATYFVSGRALVERTRTLQQRRHVTYGNQYGATRSLSEARSEVHKTYMRHVRLARIAFKDDPRTTQTLGLRGGRARSLADWLEQTALFYASLLGDEKLSAGLVALGVSKKELQQAQGDVEAVSAANRAQKKEKGQAQQTTQDRNAALAELTAWMSENSALARVLLADEPQRLEQLGLRVRS